MRTIIFICMALFTSSAMSHNTGEHKAAGGGPCWIWEVPVTPAYCVFVHGTRHDHPYPKWLEDRPNSDV